MSILDANIFKTIRKLEIQTKHLVDDILAGAYLSAFKGKGIEFDEVKEYQPGDDVRTIDWNVTARMGHPYVKNYREERELTVMLIVDGSSSSRFGTVNKTKAMLIAEIAAVLTFSAMKNNDKVGLLYFSDDVDTFLAPKKGSRHALRIIRELVISPTLNRKSNLDRALAYLGKVQQRRAVCFILSDFICPDFSHELAIISRKHDMIAIAISDPYEIAFPNINLAMMTDLETGSKRLIDTGYNPLLKSYHDSAARKLSQIKDLMGHNSGGFIDVRTDQPYLEAIKRFFKSRGKRRQ